MYKPLYKEKEILLGEGSNTIIVSGWTPIQKLSKEIDIKEYAAIGNLYSSSVGVDYLLRNLLANPQIKHVIGYKGRREDENSGSLEVLKQVLTNGVTGVKEGKWTIQVGNHIGYIPQELSIEVLGLLTEFIVYTEVSNLTELKAALKESKDYIAVKERPRVEIPKKEIQTTTITSLNNISVRESNLWISWLKSVGRILSYGTVYGESEYGARLEVLGLHTSFDMKDVEIPKELSQDIISPEFLNKYESYFLKETSEDSYTYASRLDRGYQIHGACETLSKNPSSNRVYVSTWNVDTDSVGGAEPPCFTGASIKIVNDELWVLAHFRSQDALSAWVANAVGLVGLAKECQRILKEEYSVEVGLGILEISASSGHIYKDKIEIAQDLMSNNNGVFLKEDFTADSCGNYIKDFGNVLIWQRFDTSERLGTYRIPTKPRDMRRLFNDNPEMRLDHAAYIGWCSAKREFE